ncbi:peptidase C26 [Vibrio sp. N418]|uniref:gamma-glutamyl-gamma-aminobutyrate hydrolase family protein n=1 Tax=Vibrio sp. (strain N418) TaxID=701176 RepID=UPI00021C0A2B|nr:gamma-glutamyl-gamma-aminobutyrate hydrolase family protein [Vibrio sp. N418]EGU33641.1 peptidase C26 [Vibrio sp. N418]
MKRVGLTQRVDIIAEYGERRDAVDQHWYSLLLSMEMLPILLPNLQPDNAAKMIESLRLDGIVFTGGNSLCHLDGDAVDRAPERDLFELFLIDYAVKNELPIFGVCRGMQIINYYFGGKLHPVEGHVAIQHPILPVEDIIELPKIVNSFHSWAISQDELGRELQPIATDIEGNIEAYWHPNKKVAGIMWHPERVIGFDPLDLNLMKKILL